MFAAAVGDDGIFASFTCYLSYATYGTPDKLFKLTLLFSKRNPEIDPMRAGAIKKLQIRGPAIERAALTLPLSGSHPPYL